MPVTLDVLPDKSALAVRAAAEVLSLVRRKPGAILGLATGGTPLGLYRRLAAIAEPPDFAQVRCFALDEYVGLDPHHPCAYRHYLEAHVTGPLGIAPSRLLVPDGASPHRAAAAMAYEGALAAAGGVDLWIVGIGHNGHLAFNEPGSPPQSRTRDVTLSERTRAANARFFDRPDEVPAQAITVGLGTLAERARRVMLVAQGEGKAGILAKALQGPVIEEVPASFLQEMETLALVDEATASAL